MDTNVNSSGSLVGELFGRIVSGCAVVFPKNKKEMLYSYIDLGWPITPNYGIYKNACNCIEKEKCKNAGKHPRSELNQVTKKYDVLVTKDKKQVDEWLNHNFIKYSNWSTKCGPESGIIAFDIDPRHGGKRDLFDFPPTLEYKTNSGGWRLIYKYPDFPIENNANFGEGVELIVNGFITLPPSQGLVGPYRWIKELPIAEITPEFIALGNKPEEKGFVLPDVIPDGERNVSLFKYGCLLRATGCEESEILSALLSLNDSRCKPPKNQDEVTRIVRSIVDRYKKGNDSNGVYENDSTEGESRFKLGSAIDAFEIRPPIKFIIENVIKENSLNSWYGKYGHKKTFVALSAGVCVAAGIPWIGLKTTQCPVLFIDEESGTKTLLDRLEAAIRGESQNKDIPFYYLSLSAFNFLKGDSDLDTFKKYIVQTGAKLIFIDAFDDVMAGSDENSVKDNQPVLIRLRKICEETNSAIILLHHSNKAGGMRGSTSIPGSLNSALKIESENGSSTIKISTEKMRDSKTFSQNIKIVYVEKKEDSSQLELFYLAEDDSPFDKNLNDRHRIILDYMKANNDDLVVTEFLKTFPKEEQGAYRNGVYDLRDKGIIKINADKSEHNKSVYTIL